MQRFTERATVNDRRGVQTGGTGTFEGAGVGIDNQTAFRRDTRFQGQKRVILLK
jgi:hypothetical protein